MSQKRILIVAALLSLFAGAAYAQNQTSPPQSQNTPRQGSGQGMMGHERMMGPGGEGGMMGSAHEKEGAKDRGVIGIFPALNVDKVGEPARLIVRSVAPHSPAYYAGIASGDQIVAVDGQPIDGKGLSDVATAIRGEVGTAVKLSLRRQDQSREVSLTRVEPVHDGHHMSKRGDMRGGGMDGYDDDGHDESLTASLLSMWRMVPAAN